MEETHMARTLVMREVEPQREPEPWKAKDQKTAR
jgi:hypothetical protein